MPSKVERLRARMKNMRESTQRIATNVLHSGETLLVGGATSYAEGRLSDDTGEWGFKGVPYAYMGGAVLFLTGLFAGDRYSADLFAAGTGAVGGHLFRSLYESGLHSKAAKTTGRVGPGRVPMGLPGRMQMPQEQPQAKQAAPAYGTVFDGMRK